MENSTDGDKSVRPRVAGTFPDRMAAILGSRLSGALCWEVRIVSSEYRELCFPNRHERDDHSDGYRSFYR